jgi:hypothetical protein
MTATTAAVQNKLRQSYIDDFGFADIHGYVQPWTAITAADLEAVLRVSEVLGVQPSYVLALFIIEGKIDWAAKLHGTQSLDLSLSTATATAVGIDLIRAWARSQFLFGGLGSDPYTAFTATADADNTVSDATGNHNAAFMRQISDLRARAIPGLDDATDQDVRDYFTNAGGAMIVNLPAPGAGATTQTVRATLRRNSIPSWLYLQHALFLKFKQLMEAKFKAEYGTIDLTDRPWVVYAGWNANRSQDGNVDAIYSKLFANWPGGGEVAIALHFGTSGAAPAKLPANELTRYNDPAGSGSALVNAVVYKYLVDSVSPWFLGRGDSNP